MTKDFPLVFEEENYSLLVQSKVDGEELVVDHRDQRTIRDLRRVPGVEPSTVMGGLRFRQSVGLSKFTVSVGRQALDLTLEVFPAKLDYQNDYAAMVEAVQEFDRTLPLRYFDETYRRGAATHNLVGDDSLQWLSILRAQVSDLQRALRYADSHPLMSLEQHLEYVRPSRIRHMGPEVRRAISRGHGRGPWESAVPHAPMRAQILAEEARDSLDSIEHRWLRGNLNQVTRSLTRLAQDLRTEEARASERWNRSHFGDAEGRSARSQQIGEISDLKREMSGLKELSIIRAASEGQVPSNFTSLRLLRAPGYSEAYQLLIALRLGLENIDGGVEISVDRLGQLYEAWCFVEILRQVEVLSGTRLMGGLDDFVSEGALGKRLMRGKSAEARFDLPDGRRLMVRYNRSFRGLTGKHVPDIELGFHKEGWQDLIVLFDAKYRLDSSDEQVNFYGIAAPPQDAIGALHRYRDAIAIDGGGQGVELVRPVVKGAALFPLSSNESTSYPGSKLAEALDKYGIGAIPLLPDNTEYLRSWLKKLLQLPHDELARNGPLPPGHLQPDFIQQLPGWRMDGS